MRLLQPITWGLIWGSIIAVVTWFAFVGVVVELPLTPKHQVLFYIHYPEYLAYVGLHKIFPNIRPDRFWIVCALVHLVYWLAIGVISAATYSRLMVRHSDKANDTTA